MLKHLKHGSVLSVGVVRTVRMLTGKVASEIAPAAWFLRVITATIPVLFGVSVMRCPVCGSTAVKERLERTAQGYRRFRCRCGKQFNERSTGLLNRECPEIGGIAGARCVEGQHMSRHFSSDEVAGAQ
jgi:transposase-like protein